jgi:hypothetical protein
MIIGAMTPPSLSGALQGVVRLPDWGVIRVQGADGARFLHSQLTQDIESLAEGQARLAGYCSAKGRLLASLVVWREDAETLLLACSADLLQPTLKRLSMFVLRAKAKLSDASDSLSLYGIAGPSPQVPDQVWQVVRGDGTGAIRLPDALGQPRALWCTPASQAPGGDALAPEAWAWLEVMSGVPRITSPTVEQFVPQMINFEAVGGVNFRKGCYPGQEVVARSQYRGTLKRRMFAFRCEAPAQPGQEIFHSADLSQPAGMVVNAASWNGQHALLAEVKLNALDSGSLHLGTAQGPALRREELPYPLPVDAG